MRMRMLALFLTAIFLMTGCGGGSEPAKVDWSREPGQVVFQINMVGGFSMPFELQARVPELTVFGDGRALFIQFADDGSQRVMAGQIGEEALGKLLAQADADLPRIGESYSPPPIDDAPDTFFTVITTAGARRLKIMAFSPDEFPGGPTPEAMKPLRELRKSFLDAIKDAAPYAPEQVTLMTQMIGADTPQKVQDWPADLPELPVAGANQALGIGELALEGDQAKAVAARIAYRPGLFYRQGGQIFEVAVKPAIPVLE